MKNNADKLPVSDEIAGSNRNIATMADQVRKLDALRERVPQWDMEVEVFHLDDGTTLFALFENCRGRMCGPFADMEFLHRYLDIKERLDEFNDLLDKSQGFCFDDLFRFAIVNDRYRISVVDTLDEGDES